MLNFSENRDNLARKIVLQLKQVQNFDNIQGVGVVQNVAYF